MENSEGFNSLHFKTALTQNLRNSSIIPKSILEKVKLTIFESNDSKNVNLV